MVRARRAVCAELVLLAHCGHRGQRHVALVGVCEVGVVGELVLVVRVRVGVLVLLHHCGRAQLMVRVGRVRESGHPERRGRLAGRLLLLLGRRRLVT